MNMIVEFIKNINLCYLILNILLLFSIRTFLKYQNLDSKIKSIIWIGVLLLSFISFSYFNGLVQSIFSLKYLSVKTYLIVIIITNIIVLVTMNKKIGLIYSTINYTLFILMMIIFGSIIAVILGNRFEEFYIMDISNAVTLIDLSLVIFMIYLISILLTYIGYDIFSNKSVKKLKNDRIELLSLIEKVGTLFLPTIHLIHKFRKKEEKDEEIHSNILTPEELLGYHDKSNFNIHGVDCSIIFEDSNTDNIVRNYYILLDDMDAKLVNGYTLEENKTLKRICMKLNVTNLNQIDIQNISILNRVSVEEYNFLKKIMGA